MAVSVAEKCILATPARIATLAMSMPLIQHLADLCDQIKLRNETGGLSPWLTLSPFNDSVGRDHCMNDSIGNNVHWHHGHPG